MDLWQSVQEPGEKGERLYVGALYILRGQKLRLDYQLLSSANRVPATAASSWIDSASFQPDDIYLADADLMLHLDRGWVAIRSRETEYRPGPASIRRQMVHNVAYVSVADLAQDNERPLHVLGHLIDHHLGCGGEAGGRWLSQGGGLVPYWQRAGERLPRLFDLGYAADHVAGSSVQDYFAQSLALYCRRRQELNIADPQIYRWLRSTLWDTAFWRAEKKLRGNEKEDD